MDVLDRSKPDWNLPAYIAGWAPFRAVNGRLHALFVDLRLFHGDTRESLHDAWIARVALGARRWVDGAGVVVDRTVTLSLVNAWHDARIARAEQGRVLLPLRG